MVVSDAEEVLRPEIVAEWLDLSRDKPVNLYAINLKKAQKLLERKFMVKQAKLGRQPPSTLVVNVEMRSPVALVGERSNIAIDEEGQVFPLIPFYTPKKLPKLFTGKRENFKIAQRVLKWLDSHDKLDKIRLIDVTKADASSLGVREVVIASESGYGRLNPEQIEEGLEKFFRIPLKEGAELDLRIEGIALYDGIH